MHIRAARDHRDAFVRDIRFRQAGPAPAASALVAEVNTHLAYRNAQATVAGVTGVVRRITDRAELVIATADGDRTIAPSAVAMLIEREEIPCASLSKKGTP
ncbi:hypothetical protein X956_03680 [Trueperella pyogenes TP8]|nr:hypothetical protein X956_03680 [Trueperella pyogenes TP8]